MVSFSYTNAAAFLSILRTAVDAGSGPGIVRIYGGTVPANLDAALPGDVVLLAQLTMSDPGFGAPVDLNPGARMTANAINDDTAADASGTPTFVRIFDSDLNPVLQLTAGVGTGEVQFAASITEGLPVRATSLIITMPEA